MPAEKTAAPVAQKTVANANALVPVTTVAKTTQAPVAKTTQEPVAKTTQEPALMTAEDANKLLLEMQDRHRRAWVKRNYDEKGDAVGRAWEAAHAHAVELEHKNVRKNEVGTMFVQMAVWLKQRNLLLDMYYSNKGFYKFYFANATVRDQFAAAFAKTLDGKPLLTIKHDPKTQSVKQPLTLDLAKMQNYKPNA